MSLSEQRILLTGATGGIGEKLAAHCVDAGARVFLVGRNKVRLGRVAAGLPQAQILATHAADLNRLGELETLARIAADLEINGLINLHGVSDFGWFETQEPGQLAAMIDTNLRSPMLLSRLLLPVLRQQNQALLVNVGSAYGALGYAGYSAYCASKFGLRGFSEALGRELDDTNIDVLYVAPRATRTSMAAPRVSRMNAALGVSEDDPDWVAAQIVRAIQRRHRRVHLGWPERLFVRVNQTWPRLVDWALARQLPTIKQHAHSG